MSVSYYDADGEAWRNMGNCKVRVDGEWKQVTAVYANVDGVWKLVWSKDSGGG